MKRLRQRTKWLIATAVVVVLVVGYLVVLLTPNWYRNTAAYPLWVIECGRLPVLGMEFGETPTYYLPEDAGYGPNIFVDSHFCSEEAARTAGFQRALQ